MLVGALLGGILGERWHSKLTRRAVSGKYGPASTDHTTDPDRAVPDPRRRDRRDPSDHAPAGRTGATRIDQDPSRPPVDRGPSS